MSAFLTAPSQKQSREPFLEGVLLHDPLGLHRTYICPPPLVYLSYEFPLEIPRLSLRPPQKQLPKSASKRSSGGFALRYVFSPPLSVRKQLLDPCLKIITDSWAHSCGTLGIVGARDPGDSLQSSASFGTLPQFRALNFWRAGITPIFRNSRLFIFEILFVRKYWRVRFFG